MERLTSLGWAEIVIFGTGDNIWIHGFINMSQTELLLCTLFVASEWILMTARIISVQIELPEWMINLHCNCLMQLQYGYYIMHYVRLL